jgi:hypothetical protein
VTVRGPRAIALDLADADADAGYPLVCRDRPTAVR